MRRMVDLARQWRRGAWPAWPACEEALHFGTEHLDRAPRLRGGQSLWAMAAGTGPLPARYCGWMDSKELEPLVAVLRGQAEEVALRGEAHAVLRETPEYRAQLERMQRDAMAFADTLRTAMLTATRAPNFVDNSFFLRNIDDLASSAVMAAFAFREGGMNAGRRELRFLLELAVQATYVDETSGAADFATKIELFDRRKKPNSVDHVKDLDLPLLGDARERFTRHVVRSWARASEYVHPTRRQLEEKLALRARGISPGFETADELRVCADALFHACAIAVVLTFHVVGPSFTGDMMVDGLDTADAWPFHASPFVARVDAAFDYKHERQARLGEIVARRASRVRNDVPE